VLDNSAMFALRASETENLRRLARRQGEGDVAWLAEQAARARPPAAPAFTVYTSGTTGHPKGALVAHGKHLAAPTNIVDHYPTLRRRRTARSPTCRSATCSPDVAVSLPLISRLVPHFGEQRKTSPRTVQDRATVLFTVRAICRIRCAVLLRHRNSSGAKRTGAILAFDSRARTRSGAGTARRA